jgi:hypothetical protein
MALVFSSLPNPNQNIIPHLEWKNHHYGKITFRSVLKFNSGKPFGTSRWMGWDGYVMVMLCTIISHPVKFVPSTKSQTHHLFFCSKSGQHKKASKFAVSLIKFP